MANRKRNIVIALLTVAVLMLLSACANYRESSIRTTEPTTKATTTSTTKKSTTTTTATTTTDSTTSTTTKPETTTSITTTEKVVPVTTTEPQTVDSTTQTETTKKATKPVVPTTETTTAPKSTAEQQPEDYKRLRKKLIKELNKKDFHPEIDSIFLDTLDNLYKNYPAWRAGYRYLPSTEEYITENLINIVKFIYNIEYYVKGSKAANDLYDEGSPSAWTTFDEDYNLIVGIILTKPADVDEQTRNCEIEEFFHEIIHCKQRKILRSNTYFEGNEEFENPFTEGGATFHAKFTTPYSSEVNGSWFLFNKDETRTINYNKSNCVGYLNYMNAFEKIVYLVGYDLIDKVERTEVPLSTIKETISEKYGHEKTADFLETMKNWLVLYDESPKDGEAYNTAVALEKKFLNFIEQDIDALKNKKQAKEFKPIYDFYIQNNLSRVVIIDSDKDISRKVFGIAKLDEKLGEKLK